MTDWYQEGYQRGREFALYNPNASSALDSEEHARQFSPFEFTAHEINSLREYDVDVAWEAFDRGINDAVVQHYQTFGEREEA